MFKRSAEIIIAIINTIIIGGFLRRASLVV